LPGAAQNVHRRRVLPHVAHFSGRISGEEARAQQVQDVFNCAGRSNLEPENVDVSFDGEQ
jgi:hypothetical protein